MSSLLHNPLSFVSFSKLGLTSISLVPSITFLTNDTANRGSMPEVQPARMERLPVGAIVVTVAFLTGISSRYILCLWLANIPRSSERAEEASLPSVWIKRITSSARLVARSELYGILICISMSAHPIIPRPIFLLAFVISSIIFNGYLFTSITLSRKWTAVQVTYFNLSQSTEQCL